MKVIDGIWQFSVDWAANEEFGTLQSISVSVEKKVLRIKRVIMQTQEPVSIITELLLPYYKASAVEFGYY